MTIHTGDIWRMQGQRFDTWQLQIVNVNSAPPSPRYPLEVVGYPDGKIPVTAPYQSKQEIKAKVVLPKGVACDQCVLQMSQYTGI